jgi:hypothetical protein
MEDRVRFREHKPRDASTETAKAVEDAIGRLNVQLAPTIGQFAWKGNQIELRNLVGSVRLASGTVLEVEPKLGWDGNWTEAVVQLLTDGTRIAVTGSQRSKLGPRRNDLSTAIAFEYARRLEQAVAQEGPIQVYEHHKLTSRRPNGHLNVGKWVRSALLDPTIFPIERDELTVANDFTRGLSIVANNFRRSVRDAGLLSRLRLLETSVIPGHPAPTYVNPSVANRDLPPQWAKYRPAWDIASAVLKNRSIVGDPGRSIGLEVAVEPWPLLETLLGRVLNAVAQTPGMRIEVEAKGKHPLLSNAGSPATNVIPDGTLRQGGKVVATFEAKYTRPGETPEQEHVYQALATAAALHSPLAVIVYPGDQPVKRYEVTGFNGAPAHLVTVGLKMYSYSRKGGDERRAEIIRQILASVPGP